MFKVKNEQIIKQNIRDFFIIIGVLGIATLIFYLSDIKCLFKYTVGVPCPGCGLTRAWLSFFKMDWTQAFKWHPLFWMAPFMILMKVYWGKRGLQNKRYQIVFWVATALLIIGVYSIRMVMLFPYEPPMDYNKEALVYKWIVVKEK